MPDHADLFPAEALPENRSGHLTGDQASRFQRMVSERRKSTRSLATPVGAIGLLVLVMSSPAAPAVTRQFVGWGFVAAAAVILAAPAFDPLAADLREKRVDTIQGAVGKRRVQSMAHTRGTRYYVNIGGRQLQTSLSAYNAAPDAGYVRAYFLPRTRRLVNLERLPNPPLPGDVDEARGMFGRMARTFASGDPVAFAEARADAAGLLDAVQASIVKPSDAPSERAAGGLVREALIGRWTHPLATVTLAEDGTVTITTILGATQAGHWSLDDQGRLLTDATGSMERTEAAFDGSRLTIRLEGQRLTFTRGADA